MSHIAKENPKPFETSYNPVVYRMLQAHLRMARLVVAASIAAALPWMIYGFIAMPFGVMWTTFAMALLVVLLGLVLLHYAKVNADYKVEARDQEVVSRAYSLFSTWASRPASAQRKQLERVDFTVDVEPVSPNSFDLLVVVSPLNEMKVPDISRAPQRYMVSTTGFYTVDGPVGLEMVLTGLEHALTNVDTFGGFGQQVSKTFRQTDIPVVSASMRDALALQGDD